VDGTLIGGVGLDQELSPDGSDDNSQGPGRNAERNFRKKKAFKRDAPKHDRYGWSALHR
jgi:hypothetical protein